MPWLRWLVTGLTLKQPGFHPRWVHVKYVANDVEMKQAFLWLLQFSLVRIIHQCSIPVIYILFLLEGQMDKVWDPKKKYDAPSEIGVCCTQQYLFFVLWTGSRRLSPATHRGGAGSIPDQSRWDLWWTNWHWLFFLRVLRFSCHHSTNKIHIIWILRLLRQSGEEPSN
jgi:hypothetical protein